MIAAHQSHTRANFPMWRVRPRFDMALAACLIGVLVGAAACGEPPADDPLTAARCAVVGVLCTIAGTGEPARGALGIDARRSALYLPMDVGVALQSDGSAQIHVVDWNNHRVLRIDAAGRIVAFAGSGDPGGGVPGGAAEVAAIYHPTDVVFPIVDSDRAFIALWHDDAIGRIDADGQLSVACGGEIGFSVDGTVAVGAAVHLPSKLALHPDGRLCFSEAGSQRVRCIDAEGRLVTILGPTAGQSCVGAACDGVVLGPGFGGDGGPASGARLALPAGNSAVPAGGLAFSADGTLWLADALNHRVRRLGVDTAAGAAVVATIAGSGPAFGEGGVATAPLATAARRPPRAWTTLVMSRSVTTAACISPTPSTTACVASMALASLRPWPATAANVATAATAAQRRRPFSIGLMASLSVPGRGYTLPTPTTIAFAR